MSTHDDNQRQAVFHDAQQRRIRKAATQIDALTLAEHENPRGADETTLRTLQVISAGLHTLLAHYPASASYPVTDHDRFTFDMADIGRPVTPYSGRYGWTGPSVRCDDRHEVEEVRAATSVRLQQDDLGMGYVVYPCARVVRLPEGHL